MNPKVSVIIPVYKVEKYIRRCIDSVLAQTLADFECIIVNDCSPDSSPQICDEYARKDARIKVIHKPQNEGLPQARKTGFENSTGEYIQFVDSDDWMEPVMLEKLYCEAIASGADMVACDYYRDDTQSYYYEVQTIDTENNFNNLGFVQWAAVWNKLCHRKIIAEVTFPVAGKYEDRAITQQAIFFSKKIAKIPYPLYHYCTNRESAFEQNILKKYRDWRDNIVFTVDFLQAHLEHDFARIEKETNDNINRFKLKVFRNRLFFKDPSLVFFYPKSKFFRYLFCRLLKEIFMLILPHGFFVLHKAKRRKT